MCKIEIRFEKTKPQYIFIFWIKCYPLYLRGKQKDIKVKINPKLR